MKVMRSNVGSGAVVPPGATKSNKVHPADRSKTLVSERSQSSLGRGGGSGKGGDRKKDKSCKSWCLDAIYFLCPDCSCVQCGTIAGGLLMASLLTVLFLYVGGYWKRKGSAIEMDDRIASARVRDGLNLVEQTNATIAVH